MNKPEQNGTGAKPRRQYDETYKCHAVELTLRGDRTVKAVFSIALAGKSNNCPLFPRTPLDGCR